MGPLFDVYKLAQNGVPVLIEGAQDLDAAITCVIALRKTFPGEYLIANQTTGRRILFTSKAAIKGN